jgi:hypothetical protein
MVRKGKDLFVLLGERLNPSQGGRQGAARGSNGGGHGGAGGWFRSLFRAVSETEPREAPRQARAARGRRPAAGRRTPRVPRGLLVPGWFVILLLLLGVSAGFVAGRWSVDRQDALTVPGPKNGSFVPAGFPDRPAHSSVPADPRDQPGYLPPEKQEERLSTFFFPMLDYPAPQRNQAEALARYLRDQGLEKTRIRKLPLKNGSFRWLTLCYVDDAGDSYSQAHARQCYARLRQVRSPTFEPRLEETVRRIESANNVYKNR